MFWIHGSFLVEYIKVSKKIEMFGWNLIRKKNFWNKITTCPHVFFECFKHIKRLLKHNEFSWKKFSCNFEGIQTYFKISTIFLIYSVPMVIFQKFEIFLRTIHTFYGFLFHALTPFSISKGGSLLLTILT